MMDAKSKEKGPGSRKRSKTIKVVCRFRPSLPSKKVYSKSLPSLRGEYSDPGDGQSVTCMVDNHYSPHNQTFTFDRVLWPSTTQKEVYDTVRHVVEEVSAGFNGTILAYGQTSSGKTYTMEGPSLWDESQMGIISRSVDTLFESIAKADSSLEFTMKVSYVEIYCEKVRDLLEPSNDNLQVRELKDGTITLGDATEIYVGDRNDIVEIVEKGKQLRATAPTLMNAESSRSHSLLIITVSQKSTDSGRCREGKLVLVDLAGSEKAKKTGADGMRLEEAKNINRSLTTLGMVITALSQGNSYVPYRDSKLTRILQDSLGGNSQTALVICCALEAEHSQETLSTLRFGERAKQVQNRIVLNETLGTEELQAMLVKAKRTIANLQLALSQCQCGSVLSQYVSPASTPKMMSSTKSHHNARFFHGEKDKQLSPSPEISTPKMSHQSSFASFRSLQFVGREGSPSPTMQYRCGGSIKSEVFETPNCSERHFRACSPVETASVQSIGTISDFERDDPLPYDVMLPLSRQVKKPTPKGPKSDSSRSSSKASSTVTPTSKDSFGSVSLVNSFPDKHSGPSLDFLSYQHNLDQFWPQYPTCDKDTQTDLKVTMRKEMNELFDEEVSKLEKVFSILKEREAEARKEAEIAKQRLEEVHSSLVKAENNPRPSSMGSDSLPRKLSFRSDDSSLDSVELSEDASSHSQTLSPNESHPRRTHLRPNSRSSFKTLIRHSSMRDLSDSSKNSDWSQYTKVYDSTRLLQLLSQAYHYEYQAPRKYSSAACSICSVEGMATSNSLSDQGNDSQSDRPTNDQLGEFGKQKQTAGDQTSSEIKGEVRRPRSHSNCSPPYLQIIEEQQHSIQALQAQLSDGNRELKSKDETIEGLIQNNHSLLKAKEVYCKEAWILKNRLQAEQMRHVIPMAVARKPNERKVLWSSSAMDRRIIRGGLNRASTLFPGTTGIVIPSIARNIQHSSYSKLEVKSPTEIKVDTSYDGYLVGSTNEIKVDTSYDGF